MPIICAYCGKELGLLDRKFRCSEGTFCSQEHERLHHQHSPFGTSRLVDGLDPHTVQPRLMLLDSLRFAAAKSPQNPKLWERLARYCSQMQQEGYSLEAFIAVGQKEGWGKWADLAEQSFQSIAAEAREKAVAAPAELRRDPTGRAFEGVCAKILDDWGFQVTTTKATADGGIDIVAVSDRPFQKGTYLVQCKDWTQPVGEPVLRELYGLVVAERAVKGVIITSSRFTEKATEFAVDKQLELIDGEQLRTLAPGSTFDNPQLASATLPPNDWKQDLEDGEAYAQRALQRLGRGSPARPGWFFPPILGDLRDAKAFNDMPRTCEIESEIELALADLAQALALGMPQRLWDPDRDFWRDYEFECKEEYWRASLLKSRASVYAYLGRFDEAIADCNRILYLGRDTVMARNMRADCYLNRGLYQQALEDYLWLKEHSPFLLVPATESPAQRESRQNLMNAYERGIQRCQEAITKEEEKGGG